MDLPDRDRDKAEVFNAFLASVSNTADGLRGSKCPELEYYDCESDKLPADHESVLVLLLQLNPYKDMGHDGIHLRILKELLMSS